jgi:anaerobic selenocysteine-containing dehydrogenase/ferredoxin-NADP reductase
MTSSTIDLGVEAPRDAGEIPGFCTLCRSRCGTLNRVEDGRLVSVRPYPGHPTGKAVCPKGRAAPELVHSARRLTKPLRRTRPKGDADPGFVEIEWDEALDAIAGTLKQIASETGPESVAFSFSSPSATSISDALPWLERLVWNFGSPNISWATELCNWHKDHMHKLTVGTGLPVPDYGNSDLIVLWGHNPEAVWLAQADVISRALRDGADLVTVDPRKTGTGAKAAQWLRVRPGTDGALALSLIRELIETEGYDADFVRQWSNATFLVRDDSGEMLRAADVGLSPEEAFVAFDARTKTLVALDTRVRPPADLCAALALDHTGTAELQDGSQVSYRTAFSHLRQAAARYTPEYAAGICWLEPEAIRQFARRISAAKRISYYCWTGVGQHGNATQTDRAIACLFALTGQYDAPGGNVAWPVMPMRPISAYSMLDPDQAAKALGLAERPLGPGSGGWVTGAELYRAILEAKPYRIRALVSFGSNVLSSQPDPDAGKAALKSLELQVHCDMFLNPSAMFADIVLPVTSAWERDGLRPGFELSLSAQQLLQLRPAMVAPRGEARSDFDIAAALAERLGFGDQFAHGDWDAAHDEILEPLGVTTATLRENPEGVTVPLQHGYRAYGADNGDGGVKGFNTPSRRVELYSSLLQQHSYAPVPDYVAPEPTDDRHPLVLTTAKNGYYCHTQHRGLSTLRRKSVKPRIDIHPDTARARGIAEFEPVEILRGERHVTMEARFDADLHPGLVVAEYGWWQSAPDIGAPAYEIGGATDANYNSIVRSDCLDPVSGAPAVRSLVCEVRPARSEHGRRWNGYRRLIVTDKTVEAPGVTSLTLADRDGGVLAPFKAGQFLPMRLPPNGQVSPSRSYSLIGAPSTAPTAYRVAIRRLEDGQMSGRMSDISVGEELEAGCPDGHFTLPFENEFPVVLLAAGIGITPFMSLLEQLAGGGGPEIRLYYGSRNGDHHAFRDRIAALADAVPNLTVRNFYSRPLPHDTGDFTPGRLSLERIDADLFARRARFYMCGPDEMLTEFRAGLLARGVPAFEIFHERFIAPKRSTSETLKPCDIVFRQQGTTIRWMPQDGSILEFAESRGLSLPAGCRTGQCESCSLPVVAGEVGHFVEIAEGEPDSCLACQAFPISDLVLDA